MMELTRYRLSTMESGSTGETFTLALPDPAGDLVRFSDCEALQVRLAACEAELQRVNASYDADMKGWTDKLTQAEARVAALEQEQARLREVLQALLDDCCDMDQERVAIVNARHALEGG